MTDVTISRVLAPGVGTGRVLRLGEPLSFWGGLDPETGRLIDVHHPQAGERLVGRVIVVPSGRGSSSSSSVLAESIRVGTAPAAVVLGEPDLIVAVGAIIAAELYGIEVPVVVSPLDRLANGETVTVHAAGGGPPRIAPV